jgi:transcription elongation GreA/GreB family factor
MSRAFVKDQEDAQSSEELPDRLISPHPNYVTAKGLAAIEAEYTRLQRDYAAAQAEDDRALMAHIGRDLRYFAARRASAQVIELPPDRERVHFGSKVTIERSDGRRQTFRIVGEDEADPAHGTLSHAAPLARALMGKEVGEAVQAGNTEAEIVKIA